MRLSKQLFFLSLITLTLPWVGCQAIREMDQSLRTAQLSALNATASAVAARFASDPVLRDILTDNLADHSHRNNNQQGAANRIYAHALSDTIYLDGYGDDDWLGQGITLRPLKAEAKNTATKLRFAAGVRGETLYGLAKITTPHIRYFRPSNPDLHHSDYLHINTETGDFALFASAPGRIKAVHLDAGKRVNHTATAHQIQGFWLESNEGFHVEFSLPLALAISGFELRYMSNKSSYSNTTAPALAKLITPSADLSEELSIFAKFDTRLHIVNVDQYRLASAGQLQSTPDEQRPHGLLAWLYAQALGKPHFASLNSQYGLSEINANSELGEIGRNSESEELDSNSGSGKIDSKVIRQALKDDSAQAWYQQNDAHIAQASVAIISNHRTLGAVVVEQSEGSLRGDTDNAFGRLLSYSFLASILAAVCLVAFATILSMRIRRLNEAALNAISDGGKIAEHFPVSPRGDEIGELSRSYNQLLIRLREYTQYLRSLSNKLSHELRTPLAIVRTSLDNLEHEDIGDRASQYSTRAREGASRLSHIIDAMSAASRVEQAIEHADIEIIGYYHLLNDLTKAYGSVYPHVNFLLIASPAAKEAHLKGSPELVVQALDKLIDNAVDFSPQGGQIKVSLLSDKNWMLLRVHNQGPLLPNSMQGQLFDSMVSIRSTSQPASDESSHHLGLGLYIVRLICDFHAGFARAYNNEDLTGVVFELKLPIYAADKHGEPSQQTSLD